MTEIIFIVVESQEGG